MKHWISVCDMLPEEDKIVMALINDGTDDLFLSFVKLIDAKCERWSTVEFSISEGTRTRPVYNEIVTYWKEADLPELEDIIDIPEEEKPKTFEAGIELGKQLMANDILKLIKEARDKS